MIGEEVIEKALQKVGIFVDDVYDLVNTSTPYPEAIPILISFLDQDIEPLQIKEGVVRALAVKDARGKANSALFAEYNRAPRELNLYRWAIANSIYTIFLPSDLAETIRIVQDRTNGISRQMLVMALGKVKSDMVEDILITLLDDPDVLLHALGSLGRIRSGKAYEKIVTLTADPNAIIRKYAKKALAQIEKAR